MSDRKSRGKGFGTLKKRGNSFLGTLKVKGKAIYWTIKASSWVEARRELDRLTYPYRGQTESDRLGLLMTRKNEVDRKLAEIENGKPKLLLDDAFEAYLKSPSRPDTAGDHTLSKNRIMFDRLLKWVKSNHPEVKEMRHFTKELAMEFMDSAFEKLENGTRNNNLGFYKKIWNTLIDDGRHGVEANPFMKIRNKRAENFRREAFTSEQIEAILEAVKGDSELRLLVLIGLYTGQRLGDCKNLKWGNVDFATNRISLTTQKTKAFVQIPIHTQLRNALESFGANRDGVILENLHMLNVQAICKRFSTILKKARIKALTDEKTPTGKRHTIYGFHSLRHTFISMQLNSGVPSAVVKSIVGHASIVMTEHYYHASRDAQRNAVASLPSFGGGGAGRCEAERNGAALDGMLKTVEGMSYDEKVRLMNLLAALTQKASAA